MEKIEFTTSNGVRTVRAKDDKYIMLSYYLAQRSSPKLIERIIAELESVKSGEKTFQEVFEEPYGIISIGISAGEFECDKDTAYFISNNPQIEPSIEMPLTELVELLKEWKTFMS